MRWSLEAAIETARRLHGRAMMLSDLYAKLFLSAATVLLVAGSLYGAYRHGVTTTETKWRAESAEAARLAERTARSREAVLQNQIEVIRNEAKQSQSVLDAAAVAAEHNAAGLRELVRQYASRTCPSATIAAGSAPASSAEPLLSELFGWADRRAGELAAALDKSAASGRACERAYDSVAQ